MMQAETAYLFRHALLRDAAYQLQVPSKRARLHELVLELLPSLLTPSELSETERELADHALLAAAGATPERANQLGLMELGYLTSAAQTARARYQNADARMLWDRVHAHRMASASQRVAAALALAEVCSRSGHASDAVAAALKGQNDAAALPDESETRDAEARLALALGDALAYTPESDRCIEMLQRAADLFAQSGDARGRARALCALGRQQDMRNSRDAAVSALMGALGALNGLDEPGLLGTIKVVLAVVQDEHIPADQVLAMLRDGLALLEASNADALARVQALTGIANTLVRVGDMTAALASYRQALDLATRVGARQADAMARSNLAMIHMEAGRHGEAEAEYLRALASAREAGSIRDEGRILGNLGNLYVAMRRPNQAEYSFRQALKVTRGLGSPRAEAFVVGNLAPVLQASGRLKLANRAFALCRSLLESASSPVLAGVYAALHGRLLLVMGRLDEARSAAEVARSAVTESDQPAWRVEFVLPIAFGVAVEESRGTPGLPARARSVLEDMRRIATAHGMTLQSASGAALAECEQVWAELEESHRQARPPLVYAGVLAANMPVSERHAVLLRLQAEAPAEIEWLARNRPGLLRVLKSGTEELPPPDWDTTLDPDL